MKKILLPFLLLASLVSVAQDLIVTGIAGPHTSLKYGKIAEKITIKNNGIIDITSHFRVLLYLSYDKVLNKGADTAFGSVDDYTPIKAGGTADFSADIYYDYKIFNKFSPGNYYLIALVDGDSEINETDEKNNTFVVPYSIAATDIDLSVENLILDEKTYAVNGAITPSFTIKNSRTTELNDYVFISCYLSSDSLFDISDKYLNGELIPIPSGNSVYHDKLFGSSIPSILPGKYYFIVVMDYDGLNQTIDETNEKNNTAIQSFYVTPSDADIQVTSVVATDNGYVTFEVVLKNTGTTSVSGFSFNPYYQEASFSSPPIKHDAFMITYYGPYSNIDPGMEKKFIFNVEKTIVSPPLVTGTMYFAGVDINRAQNVIETNYANDSGVDPLSRIQILPPAQVSVISLIPLRDYNTTDVVIQLKLDLLNTGSSYYYKEDYQLNIRDATNRIVHSESFTAQIDIPNETETFTPTLNLSAPLKHGDYTVELVCVSSNCATTPSSVSTNLIISLVSHTITGTVQGEDGTKITNGKVFLYKKADNGTIAFVEQELLSSNNNFSFQLDDLEYTLYFIPDSTIFHGYLPTVYGKTLMLKESSYFAATNNMNVSFDIIRVQSLGTGDGIIDGTVSSGSSGGRMKTDIIVLGGTTTSYMVVLLSDDAVVNYTYTDANGFYEFKNLPRGQYQLYVPRPLDQVQMSAPQTVDITTTNATSDFQLSQIGFTTQTGILLFSQAISFNALNRVRFGDAPIVLSATANSELRVAYTSSNPDVAIIENGKITIEGAGTTSIVAKQSGNQFYNAADDVTQILTIDKATQTITFVALGPKLSTDSQFDLVASTDSSLPVSFTSDNEAVASITNNTVTIHRAGTATIMALQPGNKNYEAATSVARVLTVNAVTGLEDPTFGPALYPNPAGDIMYIENGNTITDIELIDALGKSVKPAWRNDSIDLVGVAPGIYIIKIAGRSYVNFARVVKK